MITVKRTPRPIIIRSTDLEVGKLYDFYYNLSSRSSELSKHGFTFLVGRNATVDQKVAFIVEVIGKGADDKVGSVFELEGKFCGSFSLFTGSITIEN